MRGAPPCLEEAHKILLVPRVQLGHHAHVQQDQVGRCVHLQAGRHTTQLGHFQASAALSRCSAEMAGSCGACLGEERHTRHSQQYAVGALTLSQ